MRTIRVDITDEDYAILKMSVHFGQISHILRVAVHEYLHQIKTRDASTKGSRVDNDKKK